MANRILLRRDTAENWTTYDPILANGELGLETDTQLFKIGDGIHPWSERLYVTGPQGPQGLKGDTGEAGVERFLVQSGGAYPARDFTGPAVFIGSLNPDTLGLMLDGDTWITEEDVGVVNLPLAGAGFPEGVRTATVGTEYIDTAATNGAIKWVKATGTGNTGWKVVYGDTGWRRLPLPTGVTAGNIYLRRLGNTVQLEAADLNKAAGVACDRLAVFGLVAGWGAATDRGNFWLYGVGVGAPTAAGFDIFSGSLRLTLQTASAYQYNGARGSWVTSQPWPSTLPGTPV